MTLDAWDTHDTARRDNSHDRQIGLTWERNFCRLALQYGKSFTPHQIGRDGSASWYAPTVQAGIAPALLPDTTIWTAPSEHHEIKHKRATNPGWEWRCYGLEKYRLEALVTFARETQQSVLYTIHDWELAGAASSDAQMPNRIEHWRTVDVLQLADYVTAEHLEAPPVSTWVNGRMQSRPCYFWPVKLWVPLQWWWGDVF